MKALISPNEISTHTWVSSWTLNEETKKWEPIYSEIVNCQRVAQVEPDNKIFEVAQPLHWIDCPENCVENLWYYKDGQIQAKPQDVLMPEGE
jgi:hypothetical protein